MDPTHFDRVIRSLGTPPSPTRRTVLGSLAAGAVALGTPTAPDTEARKRRKNKCKGGLTCDGVCIDPQTDFRNCGTCGNVCGQGQSCTRGVCTDGPIPPPPPRGCADQPDLTNCGGGRQCSGGVCADPPTCGVAPDACASGLDCCGNVCDPDAGVCPLSAPGNLCRTSAGCSDGATCVGFVCQ